MGFNCGIVGLPNVGKSTLFNALTNSAIGAENYPFCTIDPNVGIVPVPDPRLQSIAAIARPKQLTPTYIEFVDIAGLVEGASRGEGLGNKFLAHIRETHTIAQVVRCFEDQNIVHVAGRIDPVADVEVINTELSLADLDTLERAGQRIEKSTRSGDKEAMKKLDIVRRVTGHVDQGRPVRTLALDSAESALIRDLHLLSSKPVLYIANVAESDLAGNRWVEQLEALADREGSMVIPVCAAIEAELARLEPADRQEFLADLGLSEPGLNRIIRAGYQLLGLDTFFTAGPKEVRAWTIRAGSTAVQAAGEIHTDFARGFIRAEVVSYEDFIRCRGEHGAREAGRWRLEGRDYVVQDGDVMLFRFNV